MNLDPRIKHGRKPFGVFDLDIAQKFLGSVCYFGDHPANFANLANADRGVLTEALELDAFPFVACISGRLCCRG